MNPWRADFPLLDQKNRGKPLIYLDSGATSQKPLCVIEALNHYYMHDNANVHRGLYELSERATQQFENTRTIVQNFIHAPEAHEIIFVKGTTEGINLVATCFNFSKGDEVIISTMEHHANIVPWQMLATRIGIQLKVIPISDSGEIDLNQYASFFNEKTKFVSLIHASNVLGTINPVKKMIAMAHQHGVPVLLDGAQAAPHFAVDVVDLDCDFYTFSSHKMYGPTGAGVLYGKTKWLEEMPPYQGGGDMIESVTFEKTTFNKLPYKFEAGTPNIAAVIGLGVAINYLQKIGMQNVANHEQELLHYALKQLSSIPEVTIFGSAKNRIGVISFALDGVHPHDIGTILDDEGIAIRAGHHCAMPLMQRFSVPAMARASLGLYNTKEDINALVQGLHSVLRIFA